MQARRHSTLSEALAAQVRAERAAAGLSRDELSERAGVPVSTLRRIESGERVATITQLAQVAGSLGLLTSQLVARAEQRAAQP